MVPRIRMVQIENYKSLKSVSVELEPFTIFVGPNGSGKSNFIDALSFAQECVAESVEMALTKRAGIFNIISRHEYRPPLAPRSIPQEERQRESERRSEGTAGFGFRLILDLRDKVRADYSVRIVATDWGGFLIARERCVIRKSGGDEFSFDIRLGRFEEPIPGLMPYLAPDRLALFAASANDEFRPLYDFLSSMRFYSIVPDVLRSPQTPDAGYYLKRDGSNACAVFKNTVRFGEQQTKDKLVALLENAVEGIKDVEVVPYGAHEVLAFWQDVGLSVPERFPAMNISDGTLRVFGILLAIYQPNRPAVVGIEEPEASVHPALSEMLFQVVMDSAQERQILVTTHSADILDQKELTDNQIRVLHWEKGKSTIAPVSNASREAIRDRLYTAGELLRVDELSVDVEKARNASETVDLFGTPFPEGI